MTQKGKMTILGIVLLVVISTAALVAFVLLRQTPQSVLNSSADTNTFVNTTTNSAPQPTTSNKEQPADTDRDGLLDDEEERLGTNAQVSDTDADGLADRAEVSVYKTNPLVGDTDADGTLDGPEVKSGKNPNGAGLLLDLQGSITNMNQ